MQSTRTAQIKQAGYARAAQGFTLMEIMIVIVLIGLIATFIGGKIFSTADQAKYHLAQTQIETVASKIENYQQDVGSLPPDLEALVKAPASSTGWLGPYAKENELKDPWGHPLDYRVPGASDPYDLISYGRDGKPGGDGLDADIRHER